MESFLAELRHVLWRLFMLVLLAPLVAYVILQCIEDLQKAWKTHNKKKKWFALTICLISLGIVFGMIQ